MLALPAMVVVIVLTETITSGIWEHITANKDLSLRIWSAFIKCHSDVVFWKQKSGTR